MAAVEGTLYKEHQELLQREALQVSPDPVVLGPDTVLVVVDVQNDFLPGDFVPEGGRFGVAEGQHVLPVCADLIKKVLHAGGQVVATRDYHPNDHASFNTQGGPFPPHCLQGHVGSHLHRTIADALREGLKINKYNVHVVYKGYYEGVDSFGCFGYKEEYGKNRVSRWAEEKLPLHCALNFTGALKLKCSAWEFDADPNGPPDVLAHRHHNRQLLDVISDNRKNIEGKTLIFTGLALDFCVLDSAINANAAGFKKIYVVREGTRAAHIPGLGRFGSGFLTSPKELVANMNNNNIKWTSLEMLKLT